MTKNVTVSCRIEEDIKTKAEDILQQLGIPVSVVINTLYRQIIANNGIPFSLTIPQKNDSADEMSVEEMDAMLEHSYRQFETRKGRPMDDVFDAIERKHR